MLNNEGDQVMINDRLNLVLVSSCDIGYKPNGFLKLEHFLLIFEDFILVLYYKVVNCHVASQINQIFHMATTLEFFNSNKIK